MRQKLAIARGLLSNPAIVLYDEPTRSLDPLSTQTIRQWIAARRKEAPNAAHILATNQLTEAEQLCDRVLIINRGELIADGSIASIRQRWEAGRQLVHEIRCTAFAETAAVFREFPGVWALEPEATGGRGEIVIRLRTDAGSGTLSLFLTKILQAGSVVLACNTKDASLDEIFC